MNIWGGDVALGHPLGISGSRVLVTLVHALMDQKKKKGLALKVELYSKVVFEMY